MTSLLFPDNEFQVIFSDCSRFSD